MLYPSSSSDSSKVANSPSSSPLQAPQLDAFAARLHIEVIHADLLTTFLATSGFIWPATVFMASGLDSSARALL